MCAVVEFKTIGGEVRRLGVPWEALHPFDENRYAIDIAREKLEHAPAFDPDNLPGEKGWGWADEVYDYYGYDTHFWKVTRK